MRKDYFSLIKEKELNDTLSEVDTLPYSSKQRILTDLLKKYPSLIINQALNLYKINYIDSNRVEIFKLKNTIVYYCELLIQK